MSEDASGILHFAGFASPCRGNFISSMEALRLRLEAEGRQMVYLFPAATKQRAWANELAEQANVYFLTNNYIKDIFLIRHLIKQYNIKIIHFHFYKLKYLFVFGLASLFKRTKKLLHLHCEMSIHSGVQGLLERILTHNKTFVGVSEEMASQAKRNFPKNKTFCAKNAIFFERLKAGEELDKQELGLSKTAKTLMVFGHDYQVKGVDLAVEAVSNLVESGKDLQLLVVVTSVEKTAAQTVERFGSVPSFVHILPARENVAEYYRLCDLFLAPSRKEGFSYAAVESSYLGLPIVLSDIAAHSQLVLPCGFYFRSGDVQHLEEQIALALEKAPQMSAELAQQASELERIYRLDEWTKQITNIYNEM